MGKFIDLTGERFGRWIALKRVGTKNGSALWECRCDCGTVKNVCSNSLRTGRTKSCGCVTVALPVNHSFFSEWSEEMAYVLGFWAADGCAHKNYGAMAISFSEQSQEFLGQIKNAVASKHSIGNNKGCYTFRYNSNLQYEDLCRIFGQDVQRKSLTMKFPGVPEPYVRHFLRGVVDGDGCIGCYSRGPIAQITSGSQGFLEGVKSSVSEMIGIRGGISYGSGAYVFRLSGIKAICFLSWIYEDSTISLWRKEKEARRIMKRGMKRIFRKALTKKMANMFPQYIPERYR